MKIALALTAATALAAGTLISAPVSAAPTETPQAQTITTRSLEKKSFTVFATFTSPRSVDYGNPQGIGNLSVAQGTVADVAGKRVGTVTTVMRVVAASSKKDAELRDTQVQIQLKDGQIFAQAVNEDPKGRLPKDLHIMSVTGGTGGYASARGTLLMRPAGGRYLMAYDVFVEKKLRSETFAFDAPVESGASGNGPQGLGDVSLLRAKSGDNSYVLIATNAGTAGGTALDSVDMQVFTPKGTLFARTIARSKGSTLQASTFAILGGTGDYAGSRGELRLSADARSVTVRLAPPAGKSRTLTWFEDGGQNIAQVDIPGGSFVGAEGLMFKTANVSNKKRKTGEYYASLATYAEIDGVTPVVGMIEQEFATSTVIVTGITLGTGVDGEAVVRPIVGGTGDYVGAAGQVSSREQASGVWSKSARFGR